MMTRRSFLLGILVASGLMLAGAGIRPRDLADLPWHEAEADPIADIRAAIKAMHASSGEGSSEIWMGRETARKLCEAMEEKWGPDFFNDQDWEIADDERLS